jgi:hypothetical protein
MGAGIGAALAEVVPGAVSAPSHASALGPAEWQRASGRLGEYLAAMGVRNPQEVERLGEAVRTRLESRLAATPLEDPVESAIEETHALLDLWLAAELGLEGEASTLCAARAAVLGGGLPGWSARWAGLSERSLAPEIRALCIAAAPEPAPLTMEPNPIDLFLHRLARRLAGGFHRLLARSAIPESATPKSATRGHP